MYQPSSQTNPPPSAGQYIQRVMPMMSRTLGNQFFQVAPSSAQKGEDWNLKSGRETSGSFFCCCLRFAMELFSAAPRD
jgi:hypothetical protein